tara:strand:- start:1294 stop:2241 length:948 start_codon:yes stop_codon:yes gene_type:complete
MLDLVSLLSTNSIVDPTLLFGLSSFFCLLIALPLAFWSIADKNNSTIVTLFVATSNLFLTALLIFRWSQSGHFPISNLYESLCFLTWALTISQLLVVRTYPVPIVSAIATPMSLISIAFASFALPEDLQNSAPLVPALRSSWLVMHVSVIMCSYAALIIGSTLSLAVLIIDLNKSVSIRSSSIGAGAFRSASSNKHNQLNNVASLELVEFSQPEQLDSLSYRCITVGFLLLTVGLISGAVWANEAWGSWWSWDPKETWAFITWLVYATYLHTRLVRGWQGRKPAFVALIGLFVILVCYIGVNLLGIGLHSYGWFF